MSFLIAKQPIFDRERNIYAFEVFLRKKENLYEYPKEVPYSRANYIMIEIILEQGIDKIAEGKRLMMNVSMDSLINKVMDSFDLKKLIIDVMEPQIPIGDVVYKQVLATVDRYTQQGALFAIEEQHLNHQKISGLLDKVHILSTSSKDLNPGFIELARKKGKKLLVTRIEQEEDYRRALTHADLFQGAYLERPIILKEINPAPYLKTTMLRLMTMVHTSQSLKEAADIISVDVGMSAKILRLVNSAYFSPISEIKSIEQACVMLGLKNLRNFLLVLAMNDYMSVENMALWKKSLTRALIAQKLAEFLNPKYTSEAYIIGLFSLVDEILNVDKIAFLREVNIGQDIIDGYTGKNTELRKILDYAIALEEISAELLEFQGVIRQDSIANIEKLTGIDSQKLLSIARSALDAVDLVLKV